MAAVSFKCPNCDGELIFDPEKQNYKCEYCGSRFSQRELDAMHTEEGKELQEDAGNETSAKETAPGAEETAGTGEPDAGDAVLYSCPSCGAQIATEKTTAATFCYYCHNPVVLSGKLENQYRPDRVIPFAVTREAAEKGFLDYVGKKKFVPKAFFNKKQIESMTGVYFPYWVFGTSSHASMQAEGRKIRTWRTGDEEFTETKHYRVVREGRTTFSNLTKNALQKANSKLASGVMPYQFDKMVPFQMGYLSGFLAERRDIEQEALRAEAEREFDGYSQNLMRESVKGYNSVSVNNFHADSRHIKAEYALFPVWTVTYKGGDGKVYYYSMNGQTGKVCGELPIAHKKVALTSLISGLVVFALVLLGGFFA